MILRVGAFQRAGDLAVLEQDQRRDRANVVKGRRARILVDIQLGDAHLAVELLGDLFQRWRNLPAGAAPLGPEIDDHRGR